MQGITLYPSGFGYFDVGTISAQAEAAGFDGIYFVELRGNNDALAAAQFAATSTSTITVGTNIVNAYMRHPSQLAAQAIAVDEISGGRLVVGIGASHRRRVESLGQQWHPPVELLTESTRVLRAAFAGEAADGAPLGRQAQHTIPIHWAGVSTATIDAAGRKADGLMMFLATVQSVRAACDHFHAGAGSGAARKPISLLTPVFLSEDLDAGYNAARRYLSYYAVMPVYQKIFAASGFEAEVAAIRGGDPGDAAGAAQHLSDKMLDAIVLVGPAARCRDRLVAFTDAGIDDPLFSPQAVGGTVQEAATAFIGTFAPA